MTCVGRGLFVLLAPALIATPASGQANPSAFTRRRAAQGGAHNQAIGRSRGGLTTEIVALVDAVGSLIRFVLLPGQRHDTVGVEPLIRGVPFDALLANKTFDVDWLRVEPNQRGASTILPPKANRKQPIAYDKDMYRRRHLLEKYFAKIKEFRGIATRYDKTDTRYGANLNLVATVILLR